MFHTLNISKLLKSDWDKVVAASPDGWIFSTYNWIMGISSIRQWDLKNHSFAVYKEKQVRAVVPLHFDKKNKILRSSGWGWSAPVFANNCTKLKQYTFEYIKKIATDVGAEKIELATPPITDSCLSNQRSINPWIEYGYSDTSLYSRVITLQDATEVSLWQDLSQNTRSIIRKVEKECRVKQVNWHDHLEHYYNLHKETCKKSNLSPHPFSYFQLISDLPETQRQLYALYDEDDLPISYHNDLIFKKKTFYHTAASSSASHKGGKNYLLMWHSIKEALKAENTYYELGIIPFNHPDSKVRNIGFFKTRFGGELHRYFQGEKTLSTSSQRIREVKNLIRAGKRIIKP